MKSDAKTTIQVESVSHSNLHLHLHAYTVGSKTENRPSSRFETLSKYDQTGTGQPFQNTRKRQEKLF